MIKANPPKGDKKVKQSKLPLVRTGVQIGDGDIRKLTVFEKSIRHICNGLYKVKKIDRKREYDSAELQGIIMDCEQGRKIVNELRDKGIDAEWLYERRQFRLADALGDLLIPTVQIGKKKKKKK